MKNVLSAPAATTNSPSLKRTMTKILCRFGMLRRQTRGMGINSTLKSMTVLMSDALKTTSPWSLQVNGKVGLNVGGAKFQKALIGLANKVIVL